MNRFTHGIIVLNPNLEDEEGTPIVHFLGLWQEPTEKDIEDLKEELKSDPEFEQYENVDELEFMFANQEHVEMFNEMVDSMGGFDDINTINLN
jgi:hypothetical protein